MRALFVVSCFLICAIVTPHAENVSYQVLKDKPDDCKLHLNITPVSAQLSGFFLYPTSIKAEYDLFPFLSFRTGIDLNLVSGKASSFDPSDFSINNINVLGFSLGLPYKKNESIKVITSQHMEYRGSSQYNVQKFINLPITMRKRTGLFVDLSLTSYPSYAGGVDSLKDSFYQASVSELCVGLSNSRRINARAQLGTGKPFDMRRFRNSFYGFVYGLGGEFKGQEITDKSYMGFKILWEGNTTRWNWLTYQLEIYTAAFFYQKTDTTYSNPNNPTEPTISKQLIGDAPKAYIKLGLGISPPVPYINK